MGKTLMRNWRACIVALAAAFFACTNYSCTSQPAPAPDNTNHVGAQPSPGATAAQQPAPTPPPWPSTFPQGLPAAVVSGNVPLAVPLPADIKNPEQLRPWFDYFSWESFIALNWPAQTGARGTPNQPGNPSTFYGAAAGTPVVWGTYKDSVELFGQGNNRPTPWDSYDEAVNPCQNVQPGQKVLTFLSKGNNPLMQTKQAFSYPLIDQQKNYVWYDIRYDQAQYNFIRGQDADPTSWLYLLKNLAPKEPIQMPQTTSQPAVLGSIMVKAAWRVKTDKDDASRYYSTNALVYDPQKKACTQTPVLLVGLHIAHKVSPFTEWVWSTFEQVDNVPPDASQTPQPTPPPSGYSFNNGTNSPATTGGFDYKPPLAFEPDQSKRKPVQVTRVNAIPTTPQGQSTVDVNAYYQQLLKGTPWQYYQLVVTQWPFNFSQFTTMEQGGVYPQDAGGAFPVNGAINTTMETYFQSPNDAAGAGGNSCMSCHYRADQSDFSWGLNRRAH